MKKKLLGICLGLLVISGMTLPVKAETTYGGSGWQVAFTSGEKMESNFKTADLDDRISGMQPGDNIIFTISLQNRNSVTTDWWMTNKVLRSLEDTSANAATHGGAYTYILTYKDKEGQDVTLFSSETLGGDNAVTSAGEGLHAATDALDEYFYLDTLGNGQSGTITLEVALDGETQGNDYQDTLADLEMNFAVELNPDGSLERSLHRMRSDFTSRRRTDGGFELLNLNTRVPLGTAVRTGDLTVLWPYLAVMALCGAGLLGLGVYSRKRGREEKEAE